MKRALPLLFAAIALFFVSCKKEHSASPSLNGKKTKVTFSVTNFAQQRASFSVAKHSLAVRQHNLADSVVSVEASGMDVLFYYVFDNTMPGGPTVHKIVQDSTFCDQFGIISDSLTAGHHYTIFIAAGKTGLMSDMDFDFISTRIGYGGLSWQDFFVNTFDIDVPAGPASYDVTLHRQVSKIELQLLDDMPANVKTIKMGVVLESQFYNTLDRSIDLGLTDTGFTYKTVPDSGIGKPNFIVDRIQGKNLAAVSVYIWALDASNHVVANAKSTNIQLQPNQRTIISGNLFSTPSPGTQNFTVKIDTAWGGSSTISF